MKHDTSGNNIRWFGWKLHILCDAKSELSISIKVTPASIHDLFVAYEMIKDFLHSYAGIFKLSHYLIDSGYEIVKMNKNIDIDKKEQLKITLLSKGVLIR